MNHLNRFPGVPDALLRGWRFYDPVRRRWYTLNPRRRSDPKARPRFVAAARPRTP